MSQVRGDDRDRGGSAWEDTPNAPNGGWGAYNGVPHWAYLVLRRVIADLESLIEGEPAPTRIEFLHIIRESIRRLGYVLTRVLWFGINSEPTAGGHE